MGYSTGCYRYNISIVKGRKNILDFNVLGNLLAIVLGYTALGFFVAVCVWVALTRKPKPKKEVVESRAETIKQALEKQENHKENQEELLSNKETFSGYIKKSLFWMGTFGYVLKKPNIIETNQLEVIVLDKERNHHKIFRFKNGTFPQNEQEIINGQKVKLRINGIFREPNSNPFYSVYRKVEKIKNKYIIIFKEKESEPIELKDAGAIDGHILFIASHSTVYSRLHQEQFKNVLGDKGKYIIYAVVIVVAVVAVVLAYPYLSAHLLHKTVTGPLMSPNPTPILVPKS
jgi:hypothetical protein